MKKLLLITFLLTFLNSYAQKSELFLSEALDSNLPTYLLEVEKAIENGQSNSIKEIFSKFVQNKLSGTYLDNVTASTLSRKKMELSSFEKPVLLITNPAWRINCKGEQPALNEIASQYKDQVKIVILYWGDHKTIKGLSKKYHRDIEILYVNDIKNKNTHIIKSLKHSLGLPLAFTVTGEKEIIDIKNRFPNKMSVDRKTSYEQNISFYKKLIKDLLREDNKTNVVPTSGTQVN